MEFSRQAVRSILFSTEGSCLLKRDTLESMSMCFPVYGSALARSHARKIWNSLKLEVRVAITLGIE
ncbi:hypothetical protein F5890DRAFT_1512179 [Lentinula detonsa]|uniref:MMS19 N-terminal domain-containing protein n=1 Tax=Lentinula detonsa TaxID=2804962 RepID=A0AA38UU05_9AGAR|nr:hypothetical protein F5890DRAFT_1512179 [Lentinula detonsa]